MEVGTKVKATKQITESGTEGDPAAVFPAGAYIHAEKGDVGEVVYVENGNPTVRFERTGTATLVFNSEIEAA